ncbi:hypothetical protein QFC20_004863 [Naganishia adeliensis]|uniref:Uncharacterized protein n=1 Tax=Naganishia adeliensis TaxID=92952 RepID=A0ACC2VVH6_9TREE|nr:hypothetical protein QFC20_004863 [Naganishia adeliensis]
MLVATAAFGAGIDVATVDVVIHAGSPRSMVDFAQESGRAGREGVWGLSIVFRSMAAPGNGPDDNTGQSEMRAWLDTKGPSSCRRTGLTEYLDGTPMNCARVPRAELCDTCRATGVRGTSIKAQLMRAISRRQFVKSHPISTDTVATPLTEPGSGVLEGHDVPFAVPQTPVPKLLAKRANESGGESGGVDGVAKRRAFFSSMSTPSLVSSSSSQSAMSSPAVSAHAVASYADRILPLANRLVSMSGVCFLCLGAGCLALCKAQRCATESLVVEGTKGTVFDAVNQLGDAVKFKLQRLEHCGFCYLPAGEQANGFHPGGKHGKCLVFKMMVPKALVYGSKSWVRRVSASGRIMDSEDPAWLRDVMGAWRMLPEPSVVNFGTMLLSKCETGETWLMRVFYNMLRQALSV